MSPLAWNVNPVQGNLSSPDQPVGGKGFGARVRESREALRDENGRRMTQSGLADAVGVTKNTVSEWERGRPPRELAKLSKLAEVLRVDTQWLLHGPGI
jgi:transcriptional regulator with XRE-family HTH domain